MTENSDQPIAVAPIKKRWSWLAIAASALLLLSWVVAIFVPTRFDGYYITWPFIVGGILALCSSVVGITSCFSSAQRGRWIGVTCIILGVLCTAYFGIGAKMSTVLGLQDEQPATVLQYTRLPPMPASAKDVHAASYWTMGDITRFWLRFNAPREDIDRFVAGPGISIRDRLIFTPEKPHLPATKTFDELADELDGMRYWAYGNNPKWFLPAVTHGCLYDLTTCGTVIVDYDKNEVYVFTYTR